MSAGETSTLSSENTSAQSTGDARSDTKLTPPFLVAAVGASAGGLEAFTRLLEDLPEGANLALILVQHLSPTHASLLPELLQKKTALKVLEGLDGLPIEPGKAYVIKPDTSMSVLDGHLRVQAREPGGVRQQSVNHLFQSLAHQYGEKAIGVVLSGAGQDGAKGIVEIKAAGGITIAQNPEEAEVDGMPRAAIATGAVELTLNAREIAEQLVRLSAEPFFQERRPSPDAAGDLDDEEAERLQEIFRLLRRTTGVDFAHYKLPTVNRRIQRRMALHRVPSLEGYLKLIRSNPAEVEQLHEDILIHVTGFFREPESFQVLRTSVLPEILKNGAPDLPIRAWVPGCSSGEEAYSLAIALVEALELDEHRDPSRVQVFGTDVSHKMVERARAGLYPQSIASEVSAEQLSRFFVEHQGGYRVRAALRERCVFARQDVTRDPPFSRLDIVLCRNLLIYLAQPLQRKVIGMFHYALKPDAFLVLGRSETIGPNADVFSLVDSRWKIYKRRPGVLSDGAEFNTRQPPAPPVAAAFAPIRSAPRAKPELDVQQEANRLLLERYAPPMVIVDRDFRIVRSRGRTGPYLELPAGEPSLDVLRMAKPRLLAALRSALHEARDRNEVVRKERIALGLQEPSDIVSVEVTPVGEGASRHFMVLFEQARPSAEGSADKREVADSPLATPDASPLVEQLQRELSDTRAHLQSMIQDLEATNEELQSANEEILSSNEELQSTNEELDTAREELQSTNEELGTVNDELQSRNAELSSSNNDLVNLLASVQIPIVMVTADLKIRRFTPAAERTLNLIASDVGRPIGHIKPNIRCPDLDHLIREVVDTVTIREREVLDADGNTFVLTIRPYKSVDNRIDGAVLVLFDVSSALKIPRETGEAIMSTVRDPILLLDNEQRVQRANLAFCEKFHVSPAETEGRLVYELGNGQWDIPGLRRLLTDILPGRADFENFVVEHHFAELGQTKMMLDGRRIESARGKDSVVLLIIRDVTHET